MGCISQETESTNTAYILLLRRTDFIIQKFSLALTVQIGLEVKATLDIISCQQRCHWQYWPCKRGSSVKTHTDWYQDSLQVVNSRCTWNSSTNIGIENKNINTIYNTQNTHANKNELPIIIGIYIFHIYKNAVLSSLTFFPFYHAELASNLLTFSLRYKENLFNLTLLTKNLVPDIKIFGERRCCCYNKSLQWKNAQRTVREMRLLSSGSTAGCDCPQLLQKLIVFKA